MWKRSLCGEKSTQPKEPLFEPTTALLGPQFCVTPPYIHPNLGTTIPATLSQVLGMFRDVCYSGVKSAHIFDNILQGSMIPKNTASKHPEMGFNWSHIQDNSQWCQNEACKVHLEICFDCGWHSETQAFHLGHQKKCPIIDGIQSGVQVFAQTVQQQNNCICRATLAKG